ncbi:MAG: ATP-binding protein [Thermoanaerobaculia bacterium]
MSEDPSDFAMVADVVTSRAWYPPTALVSDVSQTFMVDASLDAVAVVERDAPVGLLTRQKFLFAVFRRYGWELYGRKAISELADASPLVVARDMRLDEALGRAVARAPESVYDDLVVVDSEGRYEGLLSVRQMVVLHSQTLANVLMEKDLSRARTQELERLDQVKSQFLAHVTHELRSPVNAIVELSELVRMAAEKGYVGQVKDRLALLVSSAMSLRSIITNILDLSKIEAGKMQVFPERFDLDSLVQEALETTRLLVGAKPVRVLGTTDGIHEPRWFTSDPVKLRQILLNLLGNSAKFTDAGSITLSHDVRDDVATLVISDTGIGIRDEDRERLFQVFSQLEDAKTKRHLGTGLGLAISLQLVELLGGAISFTSVFGEGTAFTVRIPAIPEGGLS